jgi:hypothetical protein
MKPLRLLALLLVTTSCTGMGVGLPSNKAFFHVRNSSGKPVRLLLEDSPRNVTRDGIPVRVTRVYDRGIIRAGEAQFFQWPFAAETGRVSAVVGSDTTRSPWVLPWTKKTWRWDIQSDVFVVTTEDQ